MTTTRVPSALVAAGRAMATAAVLVVALVLCLVCSDHGYAGLTESSASMSSASSEEDGGCTTESDCLTVTARTSAAAPQVTAPPAVAGSGTEPVSAWNATTGVGPQLGPTDRSDRSHLGVWRI